MSQLVAVDREAIRTLLPADEQTRLFGGLGRHRVVSVANSVSG
jgi:hypothetical protein